METTKSVAIFVIAHDPILSCASSAKAIVLGPFAKGHLFSDAR